MTIPLKAHAATKEVAATVKQRDEKHFEYR